MKDASLLPEVDSVARDKADRRHTLWRPTTVNKPDVPTSTSVLHDPSRESSSGPRAFAACQNGRSAPYPGAADRLCG